MSKKTISGHYGTTCSIKHNNRVFVPKNVDINRIPSNYSCVAAGEEICLGHVLPEHISVDWERYRHMCDLYWEQRTIYQLVEMQKYRDLLWEIRSTYRLSYDPGVALFQVLLLPFMLPEKIFDAVCYHRAKRELESMRFECGISVTRPHSHLLTAFFCTPSFAPSAVCVNPNAWRRTLIFSPTVIRKQPHFKGILLFTNVGIILQKHNYFKRILDVFVKASVCDRLSVNNGRILEKIPI